MHPWDVPAAAAAAAACSAEAFLGRGQGSESRQDAPTPPVLHLPVIDPVDDDGQGSAWAIGARARWGSAPASSSPVGKDVKPFQEGARSPPPSDVKPGSCRVAELTPLDLAAALTSRAVGLLGPTLIRLETVLTAAVVEEEVSGAVVLAAPAAETADRLLRDYPRTAAGDIPWGVLTAVRSALADMQATEAGGARPGRGDCRGGAPLARGGWPPSR